MKERCGEFMGLVKEMKADRLNVRIYESRSEMGKAAGTDVAQAIRKVLAEKEECNMIFAAAPSQNDMLEILKDEKLPWERINAFHMDEYIGLPADAPQGFGNFLKNALFHKVNFKQVFYLNGQAADYEKESRRYAKLLSIYPTDIVCMGIGENGHIAFNDPHVADFSDPEIAKVVTLDHMCRMQQVNDGCFKTIEEVPVNALTLTIPTLIRAPYVFCVVPAAKKANAVEQTVFGEITEHCPASILRSKENAMLYLDLDSAAGIL
jgi:glucosamine-6-phosphate deaminase